MCSAFVCAVLFLFVCSAVFHCVQCSCLYSLLFLYLCALFLGFSSLFLFVCSLFFCGSAAHVFLQCCSCLFVNKNSPRLCSCVTLTRLVLGNCMIVSSEVGELDRQRYRIMM